MLRGLPALRCGLCRPVSSAPRRQAGVVAEVVHLAAPELAAVIYMQVGQEKKIGGRPRLQAAAVLARVPG